MLRINSSDLNRAKRKGFGVVGKKIAKAQVVLQMARATMVSEKRIAGSVAKKQALHEVAAQAKKAEGEPVETV